jgi:hypothetical protein
MKKWNNRNHFDANVFVLKILSVTDTGLDTIFHWIYGLLKY